MGSSTLVVRMGAAEAKNLGLSELTGVYSNGGRFFTSFRMTYSKTSLAVPGSFKGQPFFSYSGVFTR